MKRLRFNAHITFGKPIFLIGFFLILYGTISVLLGKDLTWDTANYHLYNPYAFLNDRFNIDYWPTSFIHQFFAPTLDFILYFFVMYTTPFITEFMIGAIHGINACLLYFIAYHFLYQETKTFAMPCALLFALFGTFGAIIIPRIGGFENDHFVSIFVLSFILLQIKACQAYLNSKKFPYLLCAISGCLLGISIGLKLTSAIFFVGALFAYLFINIPLMSRIKLISILGCSVLLGWFISSGYWMWLLWQHYENPLFPFFNHIFHSPYFPDENLRYDKFIPSRFLEIVLFPFYFSWQGTEADTPFRDLRYVSMYVLFMVYAVFYIIHYCRFKKTSSDLLSTWLFIFTLFSYLAWLYYFAIVRYLAPLAMLAPLIIYLLIKKMIPKPSVRIIITTIFFLMIILNTRPTGMMRVSYYGKTFFDIRFPKSISQTPRALVLMAYPVYALNNQPKPQTYLIPFFKHTWQFAGIPFMDTTNTLMTTDEIKNIRHIVNHYHGPIYLLSSKGSMDALYKVAKRFSLIAYGPCEKIRSDRQIVSNIDTLICPVMKMPDKMTKNAT